MIIKSGCFVEVSSSGKIGTPKDSPLDIETERADEIIEEAEKEAERIIEQARNQAISIKKTAEKSVEELRIRLIGEMEEAKSEAQSQGYEIGKKKGYDEGIEQGIVESREKVESEREDILRDAKELHEDIFRVRERLAKDLETDVVKLVSSMFEKIVRKLTVEDETLIASMVEENIKLLDTRGAVSIITSRKDYDYLVLHKDEMKERLGFVDEIDIKCDSDMAEGDCIIETERGNVDISISKQLRELKKFLSEASGGEV